MAKFHYSTIWQYTKEDGTSYTEAFNHGDEFDNMMRDLHEEELSGRSKSYNINNKIAGYKCLLVGIKIQTEQGYIEKEYNDSTLLEYLEEYEKCLD